VVRIWVNRLSPASNARTIAPVHRRPMISIARWKSGQKPVIVLCVSPVAVMPSRVRLFVNPSRVGILILQMLLTSGN
jgi:hypothetical protein